MLKMRWSLLALMLAGLLTLAACSDDDDEGTAPDTTTAEEATDTDSETADSDASKVALTLKEWSIDAPESTSAGPIEFEVKNGGGVDHQLTVIRTDLAPDALETDSGIVPEDTVDVVGIVDTIPGGGEQSATIELTAGNYVLICNIPGHYDLKMRTALTVN